MSTIKRVVIISEIYYPVKTSTGYYMTEIAEYLAKKGSDVHVICTGAICNKEEVSVQQKEEFHKGVNIHRTFFKKIDKNNFFKRIIRLVLSSLYLFSKTLSFVRKGDKILIVTNPAFLILMMPYIAWRKKVKYTILVHDVFPENLLAIKKISSSSILYKMMKKVFDSAYSKANECIVIGRDMAEVLAAKICSDIHISVIPIWAEVDAVYPVQKKYSHWCNQLRLEDKFIFQFAGNLGHVQGIDNLLKSISLIDEENIHFLFVGGGAKYEEVEAFIVNSKKRNVSLLGFQDRSLQNDFLNTCDIGIVTLSEGMYGLGVPSKSYNIMASGRPILFIGDENSEIAKCINEYGIGWIVKPNDPVLLKETIENIYSNRMNLSLMMSNARKTAEEIYAKEKVLEKYYSLFK